MSLFSIGFAVFFYHRVNFCGMNQYSNQFFQISNNYTEKTAPCSTIQWSCQLFAFSSVSRAITRIHSRNPIHPETKCKKKTTDNGNMEKNLSVVILMPKASGFCDWAKV